MESWHNGFLDSLVPMITLGGEKLFCFAGSPNIQGYAIACSTLIFLFPEFL